MQAILTGAIIAGGVIAILVAWNIAIRSDNQRLAGDNRRLNAELAEIAEREEKTAAELQRMTEKAAALRKAGRKGEDQINAEIKKGSDPCLGRRADDAMLNLLRDPVSTE